MQPSTTSSTNSKPNETPLPLTESSNTATKRPALYKHQTETVEFRTDHEHVFDASDPGTGKTLGSITAFAARRAAGAGPLLVFAPKTILEVAWAADIRKFCPHLTYAICQAHNRAKTFALDVDIYLTNHDAANWVAKHWKELKQFHRDDCSLDIDESTAYKNPNAQRSKAIAQIAPHFKYRSVMSGTPNPNSVLELWHQAKLCDGGQRLGNSYWKFRSVACEPVQVGPGKEMIEWRDKPGVEAAVFDLLSDITIRHRFEDCISIPPNVQRPIEFDLPPALRKIYDQMQAEMVADLQDGSTLSAIHAASKATKLLQIASGAVYSSPEEYVVLDDSRTQLIMDLVEARSHTLVGFLWKHQRDTLIAEAEARGMKYAVIDGSVKGKDRTTAVEEFQAGELKVIFAHPQSAGHGITLTKGIATIWASPTYNAEHYKQFFHRIYRNGQDKQTETIHILARNTLDMKAARRRDEKLSAMQLLLDLMETA